MIIVKIALIVNILLFGTNIIFIETPSLAEKLVKSFNLVLFLLNLIALVVLFR